MQGKHLHLYPQEYAQDIALPISQKHAKFHTTALSQKYAEATIALSQKYIQS